MPKPIPRVDGEPCDAKGWEGKRPSVLFAGPAALYVGYLQDSWTTIVGHFAPDDQTIRPVATLPMDVGLRGIAIAGPWLVATSMGEIGESRLYVAPLRGAGFVIVAEHVRTLAAMGPAGVTFVDGAGKLLVISMDDLDAAANSAVPRSNVRSCSACRSSSRVGWPPPGEFLKPFVGDPDRVQHPHVPQGARGA